MAHAALIDENGVVLCVIRIPDEQENRVQEYCAEDLKLGGRWLLVSYNDRIRRRFPAAGMLYVEHLDMFAHPQPFPSWGLDGKADWQPPKPRPSEKHGWDEDNQEWVLPA